MLQSKNAVSRKALFLTCFSLLLSMPLLEAVGHTMSPSGALLLDELGPDWRARWQERQLSSTPTRFVAVDEDGRQVLMAHSSDAASALWLPFESPVSERMDLSWRWKVTRGLTSNSKEREKSGDDYAARLLVAFGPDPFSKKSRALCYVWAAKEPVGSLYTSPYSANVATLVLQSGNRRLGEWVTETRDIVADYRRAFGSLPDTMYAVAVMVDTDNTHSRATAWFSDINLLGARHISRADEP